MEKFAPGAEEYAKKTVAEDCPTTGDWVNVAHDFTAGYNAGAALMVEERAFWASKFEHWETCNKSGATFHSIKAQGYKDCAAVLRKNDRWMPR